MVAELFESFPASPVLRTFVQYLIAFCSRLERATDALSSRYIEQVCVGVHVKPCDSRSNDSRDIRAAHFVMDDDERMMRTQAVT